MATFNEIIGERGASAVAAATGYTRQHVYLVRSGQSQGSLAFWAAVKRAFPAFSLDLEAEERRQTA
jgi:DNA-binding phage protein